MPNTNYDYAQEVHLVLLTDEIEASAIVTALAYIDYDAPTTSVWFKAALSAGDVIILDALIAAHDMSSYVSPIEVVETTFKRQEESDENIPYVYSSPRPMHHYSYFSSVGDGVGGIGTGPKMLFDMADTDVSKTIDLSYNEHVYLKDGLVQCMGAPFGATVDIDIYHPNPAIGFLLSFGKQVPLFGDFPIALNTEDRASVPAGLIVRVTVNNATGSGGEAAAANFKVFGRLELYRPKPAGV